MRLQELLERRVTRSTARESLRPLSDEEVRQVAGAAYTGGPVIIVGPVPHPVFPEPAPNPVPFPRGPIGYLP
jgi:hypothetical protein